MTKEKLLIEIGNIIEKFYNGFLTFEDLENEISNATHEFLFLEELKLEIERNGEE